MRFDDMLATVLHEARKRDRTAATSWRQIIDLLAQGRDGPAEDDAYDFLDELRGSVPAELRRESAGKIAAGGLPPRLVAFFAADAPVVAAPLLRRAMLRPEEWVALLPGFSPSARALLRHREDLDPVVVRALADFGRADLVVEGPAASAEPAVPEPEPGVVPVAVPAAPEAQAENLAQDATEDAVSNQPSQIRELLARIEGFRSGRPVNAVATGAPAARAEPAVQFRFEADADGTIFWVDGVPRGAFIGQTIAVQAEAGEHGVDGQAAGAFRRRAPFRNARLSIAGEGPGAGQWRISAAPFFDQAQGRFLGYRGNGRRPRADETAVRDPGAILGPGLAPNSVRQLVHELRTPLSAIQGFADMIDGQVLGPAATGYRERASDIAQQARRLLAAVEDLDMAARLEGEGAAPPAETSDGAHLLARVAAEYLTLARERGVALSAGADENLPALGVGQALVERMMVRLLAATVGLAGPGEAIAVALERDRQSPDHLLLSLTRPAALGERGEADLLDPGYTPDGDFPDAPALGLGFALRLVRNLARSTGGALEIRPGEFRLRLPIAKPVAESGRHSG